MKGVLDIPEAYRKKVELRLLTNREIRPNGCWHYTRPTQSNGYCHTYFLGKARGVHRVSYLLFVGPIADGMNIDHRCHNDDPDCPGGLCAHRRCFNPDHLAAVTPASNLDNGKSVAAILAAKTHCNSGHEFTPTNTYIRADGCRTCRQCQAAAMRRYRLRQRNASRAKADAA